MARRRRCPLHRPRKPWCGDTAVTLKPELFNDQLGMSGVRLDLPSICSVPQYPIEDFPFRLLSPGSSQLLGLDLVRL